MTCGIHFYYSCVDQLNVDWFNPAPLAPLSYIVARIVLGGKVFHRL